MPKIRVEYWAKPIPPREFDWVATYDGDEPREADGSGGMGIGIGYGASKQAAIDDLLTTFPPPCVDCGGEGGILPGIICATCEGSGERMPTDELDPLIIVED